MISDDAPIRAEAVAFAPSAEDHKSGEVFLRVIGGLRVMISISTSADGKLSLVLAPEAPSRRTIVADLGPLLRAMAGIA